MARARVKTDRRITDIADVIISEWFRILPASSGAPLPMDKNSLQAAFNQILDAPCEVILDVEGQPIKIVVPVPPAASRTALIQYLDNNKDFQQGMGVAMLFGCGR